MSTGYLEKYTLRAREEREREKNEREKSVRGALERVRGRGGVRNAVDRARLIMQTHGESGIEEDKEREGNHIGERKKQQVKKEMTEEDRGKERLRRELMGLFQRK